MEKIKLTEKHFCYVMLLDMSTEDFIEQMDINEIVSNLDLLSEKNNKELYLEARKIIESKNKLGCSFEFEYDIEPFVFKKYIDGIPGKEYRICVFQQNHEKVKHPIIKTSDFYIKGMPLFFDADGNMIKHSLN